MIAHPEQDVKLLTQCTYEKNKPALRGFIFFLIFTYIIKKGGTEQYKKYLRFVVNKFKGGL